MAAFIAGAVPGAFVAKGYTASVCAQQMHTPRMALNPGPPDFNLYLSRIPLDRLNKAPMITITAIPGASDEFNSVAVSLCDMPRDESAGNSLKAGVVVDETLEGDAPAPEKYEKYFPRGTLHEAPFISLTDRGTELTRSMSIIQCQTPTSISAAKVILGDGVPPSPEKYKAYNDERLNMAPCVQANFGTSEENSSVQAPFAQIPLDYAGAQILLKKYRR